MNFINKNSFLFFVVKFLLLFAIFYFGTIFFIGLAAPGGFYSSFFSQYFDYVSWLKISYLKGASVIASLFGYSTIEEPGFLIRVVHARGVIIAYDCIGYGVMSFWAGYVLANTIKLSLKLKWLLGGLLMLWFINTLRIGLFLVAINKKWSMPFYIDHHTWFNIFAYGIIFIMMLLFNYSSESKSKQQ